MTPPDTLSCNRSPWLTFTITMVTQPTSGDLFGIPLQCTLREHARGAELFLRYGERKRETQTRGGQTELWFPLQVCESQTRGREGPKKRLFQDGCYRNVISRKGVADACRDVSMAVPCMCGDKYHMTQSTLCTNELCSALLGKVYDSLVFCFFVFFLSSLGIVQPVLELCKHAVPSHCTDKAR